MKNILKSFFQIWTYPLSIREQNSPTENFGKNEIGISKFFRSVEIFSKVGKYSFK